MKFRFIYIILTAIFVAMGASVFYFLSFEQSLEDKDLIKKKPDPVALVELEENRDEKPAGKALNPPTEKRTKSDLPAKQAQAPRKNLNDLTLQRRLDSLPSLPRRTVISGTPIPFEVSIPAGWKILSWNNPVTAVVNHRSIINLEVGPWATSLDEYTNITRKEMMERFPLMKLTGEETITIDQRTWKHLVLRGQVTGAGEDHEVSILVYGSKRGSYRFIIEGDRRDLEKDALDITLMLTSFRFPPDNFEPEDVSEVRIYVNGERVIH